MNFHEWWVKYKEQFDKNNDTSLVTGGFVWMAAFAAWQYCEALSAQRKK